MASPAPVAPLRPAAGAGVVRLGRDFIGLDRVDLLWLVALVLMAFAVRAASPVYPNVLLHPGAATPVSATGLGFPSDQDNDNDEECAGGPSVAQGAADPLGVPVGPNGQAIKECGFVFDEIYFPVDAAKDLHQPPIDYFDPEPPLTKLLMAPALDCNSSFVPWALNGGSACAANFTPARWRIVPAIAGSLFVGLIYLIARRLRRDRFFAVCAAGFVGIDGLALVESRTGVIDMIAVFFVGLMYYLFLLHWQARTKRQWRATLYLLAAATGLAFGAKLTAIAPTAVAGGFLLARVLEPTVRRLPLQQLMDRLSRRRRSVVPRPTPEGQLWRAAAGGWPGVAHYGLAGLLAVGVFFACFARYSTVDHNVYRFTGCSIGSEQFPGETTAAAGLRNDPPTTEHAASALHAGPITLPNVKQVVGNAVDVMALGLQYHNNECHDHPYSSRWYTWPLDWKPVLFYLDSEDNANLVAANPTIPGDSATKNGVALTSSVSNSGNPPMWWIGILGALWCAWRMTRRLPLAARGGIAALGALSLAVMIVSFHAAEGANDITGVFDPVRVHPSLWFDVGIVGMALFCGVALLCGVIWREFVAAFVLLGYIVAWLMWAPGNEKRVLFFYHMLGALPFIALAAAYGLTSLRRVRLRIGTRTVPLAPLAWAGVVLVIAGFLFFYPMWTGLPQYSSDRSLRLWFFLNW